MKTVLAVLTLAGLLLMPPLGRAGQKPAKDQLSWILVDENSALGPRSSMAMDYDAHGTDRFKLTHPGSKWTASN